MGLTDTSTVYTRASFHTPRQHALAGANVVVFTRRAPYKESPNEDASALIATADGAFVLAVADGLGGLPAGAAAAALAVNVLAERVGNARTHKLREPILDSIERANREILALGNGAATTLAVVEIRGSIARTYHIGDAGVLITGQRGGRRLQTLAHSPTGYAQEAGLLEEADALNHDERNIVSNVLGSHELRIEIGPLRRLAPRDTVIIASDGLFDNLLNDEIVEYARRGGLKQAADALAEKSLLRMQGLDPLSEHSHPDDLTFILYRQN